MRIGIDARCLEKKVKGYGVARILNNLLKEWAVNAGDCEFILYYEDEDLLTDRSLLESPSFKLKMLKLPKRLNYGILWENVFLPMQLYRDKVDLLFSPFYTTALTLMGKPRCVVVHDISYKALKGQGTWKQQFLQNIFSYLSCKFATGVITDSKYSKNEINKYYGINKAKISVIYPGIDDLFLPLENDGMNDSMLGGDEMPKNYLLYVGTIFNRRNMPVLLDAYNKILSLGNAPSLIIVGNNMTNPRIDMDNNIDDINNRERHKKVWHLKYVDEKKLLALYQNCQAFIYPSSYEGFGFPPLEAMACGKPVITGDRTSLPEVVADGAVCVDPEDANALYKAIKRVIEDKVFAENLTKKALARAATFKWDMAAKQYLDIFRSYAKSLLSG